MKPRFRTNRGNIGNELFIQLPDLTGYPKTFLTADASASATSFSVADGTWANASDYIVVGVYGEDQAEVQKLGTPTSTSFPLSGASTFAHATPTEVRFIPVNQVVIQSSSDGVAYSNLATVSLKVSNPEMYYLDTAGAATTYYRIAFKNETSGNLTDYSDPLIATGYADGTVFAVKLRAIRDMGLTLADIYKPNAPISDAFLNDCLFQLRRTVHELKERWSFRQQFEYQLGNLTAGRNYIALPDDMEDPNTSQNLSSVRIGTRPPLSFITKRQWTDRQQGRAHTTLSTAISSTSDTTIVLTESGDFDESGDISIIDAGTEDQISYTGNTESTDTLSGVTGITATHAAGLDVWQNPSFSIPQYYTVFEGKIWFECPVDADYHNETVIIDYYKTITPVDSDADTFEEPDFDLYVFGLKAMIRANQNKGNWADDQDPDYKEFTRKAGLLLAKEKTDVEIRLVPDLPHRRLR